MEVLFILIPLSVILIAFALWSFVWSVKNDQFEDLDRQGWSILFDEKSGSENESESTLKDRAIDSTANERVDNEKTGKNSMKNTSGEEHTPAAGQRSSGL